MFCKKEKYFYQVGAKKAFKTLNNTFTALAVTSRQAHVNSFLKENRLIIDFNKFRPLLKKNIYGVKAYAVVSLSIWISLLSDF